jgi:hypothetical protein
VTVLARNAYGREEAAGEPGARRLADYLLAQAAALAAQPGSELLAGRLAWAPAASAGRATGATGVARAAVGA